MVRVQLVEGLLLVIQLLLERVTPGGLLEHLGQLLLIKRQLLGIFVDRSRTCKELPACVAGLDDQRIERGVAHLLGQGSAVDDVHLGKVLAQCQQGDADCAVGPGFTHVLGREVEVDHFARRDDFDLALQGHGLGLLGIGGFNPVDIGVSDSQVVGVAQVGAGGA